MQYAHNFVCVRIPRVFRTRTYLVRRLRNDRICTLELVELMRRKLVEEENYVDAAKQSRYYTSGTAQSPSASCRWTRNTSTQVFEAREKTEATILPPPPTESPIGAPAVLIYAHRLCRTHSEHQTCCRWASLWRRQTRMYSRLS